MDKQTNRHGFKFKDSSVGYSTKLVCTCKPESDVMKRVERLNSEIHERGERISELRAQLNETKAKLELERVETRELKEKVDSQTKIIIKQYDVELSHFITRLESSQFLEKQAAWDSQSHELDLQISELRAQLNEAKAKLELERVETRELKEQNTTIIKQYDVELSNLKTKLKSSQDEERAKTHALEALTKKLEEKEVEHQKLKHVVEKKFEETNLVVESSVKKCFTEMKERNIELENKNSQLQSYIDNIQHVVEKKFEETNLVVESVKKGFTEMKERNTELENKNSQLQSYIDNTQDRECSSSLGEEFELLVPTLTDSVRLRAALNQTRKRPIQKSVGRTVGRTRRKKPLQ